MRVLLSNVRSFSVPSEVFLSGPAIRIFKKGDKNASVTCYGRGHPAPNVTWTKGSGETVLQVDDVSLANKSRHALQVLPVNVTSFPENVTSRLYLRPSGLTYEEAGNYTCTSSNGVGGAAETRVEILCEWHRRNEWLSSGLLFSVVQDQSIAFKSFLNIEQRMSTISSNFDKQTQSWETEGNEQERQRQYKENDKYNRTVESPFLFPLSAVFLLAFSQSVSRVFSYSSKSCDRILLQGATRPLLISGQESFVPRSNNWSAVRFVLFSSATWIRNESQKPNGNRRQWSSVCLSCVGCATPPNYVVFQWWRASAPRGRGRAPGHPICGKQRKLRRELHMRSCEPRWWRQAHGLLDCPRCVFTPFSKVKHSKEFVPRSTRTSGLPLRLDTYCGAWRRIRSSSTAFSRRLWANDQLY